MRLANKFQNLINAYKDDSEMLEFIVDRLCKMPEYVNKRVQHIIYDQAHSIGASRDENVINKICELDKSRSAAHDTAICACEQLNRACDSVNIPHIFEGDINKREDVANFAAEITITFFDYEKMYTRTEPEELVDDMIFDKYYINVRHSINIEEISKNANIHFSNNEIENSLDNREEDDLELEL